MTILIFIFGLIIGSFLNAVIYRLGSGESILEKSSKCPNCKRKLSTLDLVPLASFFLLQRRCRYCRKPISWQYPLVELATAISFALIYWLNQGVSSAEKISNFKSQIPNGETTFQWVFVCFLIIIFVYDFKHYLILDKIIFPAAILGAIYQIWRGDIWAAFLGAILLSGFFALLYLISKGRWIGAGDVKLGIYLGFLVPFPQTLALFFLAYLLGALVAIIFIAAGKKQLHDRLPFGTFLTFAAFLAMLWGEELTKWYLRLIGIS